MEIKMEFKILKALSIVLWTSVLIFSMGSRAEADYFYESRQDLDNSLTNLKESVHKAMGENKWLKDDSQRLRTDIGALRNEYQKLRLKATQLRAKCDSVETNLSAEAKRLKLANKEYHRLQQNMDLLSSEEKDLTQRLGAAEDDFKKFREETIFLEQQIAQMKEKLLAINDENKTAKLYEKRRRELVGVLNESEHKANKVKITLNKIKKKYEGPLSIMKELTAEKNALIQGIDDEKEQIKMLAGQENSLLEEIDNLDSIIQNETDSLHAEIQEQKKEKQELEEVLEKAQLKIKQHDITARLEPLSHKLLKQNLTTLQKENDRLNKEIAALQKVLSQ